MKHFLSHTALSVAALAVFGLAASAADAKGAEGAVVRGRITSISSDGNQLTLKTLDGRKVTLKVDADTRVRIRRRAAKLADLTEGAWVRARYVASGDTRRALVVVQRGATAAAVAKETRNALSAAKSYTFAQKDEYARRLRDVLDDLDDRIDDLQQRARTAGKDTARETREKIRELRGQAKKLRGRLDEVRSATAPTWDKVKSDLSSAAEDFQNAIERTWESLKK